MDDHLQIQGQDGFVEHDGLKRSCLFTEPGESLVNGWPDDHRKVLSATGTGQQIGQEGMIHQKQDRRVRIGEAQRRREDGHLVASYRLPQGALPVREMQTPGGIKQTLFRHGVRRDRPQKRLEKRAQVGIKGLACFAGHALPCFPKQAACMASDQFHHVATFR